MEKGKKKKEFCSTEGRRVELHRREVQMPTRWQTRHCLALAADRRTGRASCTAELAHPGSLGKFCHCLERKSDCSFCKQSRSKMIPNYLDVCEILKMEAQARLAPLRFLGILGGNQALIKLYLTSVFKIICFWSSKHFDNIYLWYALNISLKNAEDIFPIWELSTGGLYYTIFSFTCLLLTNIREIRQMLQFKLSSYLKVYISFKVYFQHEKS